MVTVKDYIGKLRKVDVKSLTASVIKENEQEILDINREQLDDGENYIGQIVGKYAKSTEQIAKIERPNKPKKAGQPFNFDWTGSLLGSMYLTYRNSILFFDSRGKGDNEKSLFVKTNRLLGVNDQNSDKINYFIILPNLQKKIKRLLG